jgi:FkbM family methyltransferase
VATDLHPSISDAATLLKERRFPEADSLSDELLKAFPAQPEVLQLKALCRRNLGDLPGGHKWARRALAACPGYPGAIGLLREIYSRPQYRWLMHFYGRPVDLVIDVGGNTGGFGLELRHSGYEGRIVSIEPVAEAFAKLGAERVGDPAWAARHMALGRTAGKAMINVAANDAASSSLLAMSDRQLRAAPESRIIDTQEVVVDTLDHFYESLEDRGTTRMLKLDTQGYEGEILAGGTRSLAEFSLVYVELSVTPLYQGQALMHEIIGTLHHAGFEIIDLQPYMVEPGTGNLLQLNSLLRNTRRR